MFFTGIKNSNECILRRVPCPIGSTNEQTDSWQDGEPKRQDWNGRRQKVLIAESVTGITGWALSAECKSLIGQEEVSNVSHHHWLMQKGARRTPIRARRQRNGVQLRQNHHSDQRCTSDTRNFNTKRFWQIVLVAINDVDFRLLGAYEYSHSIYNQHTSGNSGVYANARKVCQESETLSLGEKVQVSMLSTNHFSCTHKWGTILVRDCFKTFDMPIPNFELFKREKNHEAYQLSNPDNHDDYRHVLVKRNWFDAIVSGGYLYHKAGLERWIDYQGNDRERTNRINDWDLQLMLAYMTPCHLATCLLQEQVNTNAGWQDSPSTSSYGIYYWHRNMP